MSTHYITFVQQARKIAEDIRKNDSREQEQLLTDLFLLEDCFREILKSHKEGMKVYENFMSFIVNEKKNILTSRVYFRERQTTFNQQMIQLFKLNKFQELSKFKINYQFIKWVMNSYSGPHKEQLKKLHDQVVEIRKKLTQKDVYLAFSRVKIFWSKTPSTHLEYMDLIQDACEGYMHAIDKFVPPYTLTFRSVAIGRITLRILTDYNATVVNFSPNDQRMIYRMNNAKYKEKLSDTDDILNYVKQSYPQATKEKLASLDAASRVSSMYTPESSGSGIKDVIDITNMPDQAIIRKDFWNQFQKGMNSLTAIQRKVFLLKYGTGYRNM